MTKTIEERFIELRDRAWTRKQRRLLDELYVEHRKALAKLEEQIYNLRRR